MDGLIALALAKKYTDKVGQDIISAGFKVQVEEDRSILNRQGEEKVLYLLPKEHGSSQDGYDEFVYANRNWEWVGKTDVDLDYEELDNLPKINGITLSGNKINSDLGFSNFYYGENNPPIYTSSAVDYQLNDIWINTITNTAFRLGYKSRKDLIWYPLRVKVFLDVGTPPEYENENVASLIYNTGDLWINRGIIGGVRPSYYSNGIYMCLGSQPQTTPPYNRYNISWVRLDTRIISAIVNANGTITFTDSEGNSFTTSGESVIGPQGAPGKNYVLTTQDKTDIANIVLSELPTTQGVLYGNQSN